MPPKKGTVIEGIARSADLPSNARPKAEWGKQFSSDSGFSIPLEGDNTPLVFLDKRLLSGDEKQIRKLASRDFVGGHVITCEKKEWVLRCEPTNENEIGVIAYTEKGKAILAGIITLQEKGAWKFSLKTLYPRISNKKKHSTSVKGEVDSDGKGKVTVEYKIEF